jgi:hypothetical protein
MRVTFHLIERFRKMCMLNSCSGIQPMSHVGSFQTADIHICEFGATNAS